MLRGLRGVVRLPGGTTLDDSQQVFRQNPINIGEREAFIGIAVCAIASDGLVDSDEVRSLSRHLSRLRMYADASAEEIEFTLARTARLGEEAGLDKLLAAACRVVPEKLREAAYAFAVDVVLSDRELGIQEQVFLERLRNRLNVDMNQAATIQSVARIRHLA